MPLVGGALGGMADGLRQAAAALGLPPTLRGGTLPPLLRRAAARAAPLRAGVRSTTPLRQAVPFAAVPDAVLRSQGPAPRNGTVLDSG